MQFAGLSLREIWQYYRPPTSIWTPDIDNMRRSARGFAAAALWSPPTQAGPGVLTDDVHGLRSTGRPRGRLASGCASARDPALVDRDCAGRDSCAEYQWHVVRSRVAPLRKLSNRGGRIGAHRQRGMTRQVLNRLIAMQPDELRFRVTSEIRKLEGRVRSVAVKPGWRRTALLPVLSKRVADTAEWPAIRSLLARADFAAAHRSPPRHFATRRSAFR